jgi:hypothetical protein
MRDKDLYAQILGLTLPWSVAEVELDTKGEEVRVLVEHDSGVSWALRSQLEPIRKVAKMIREHMWGIINAIVHRATNAGAESINAKIQRIKRMACGYRNRDRFRNAIYFHLGGLNLYPATSTHTNS